jgi:hypothetical protein
MLTVKTKSILSTSAVSSYTALGGNIKSLHNSNVDE